MVADIGRAEESYAEGFYSTMKYPEIPPEFFQPAELLKLADMRQRTRVICWLNATATKTDTDGRIKVEGDLAILLEELKNRSRKATDPYLIQTDEGQRVTHAMLRKRFDSARQANKWHKTTSKPQRHHHPCRRLVSSLPAKRHATCHHA